MRVTVVTPPAAVVDLALVKTHLVVDHSDHDTLIAAYLAAATASLDGPDGWLGRSLGVQTLEARLDSFGYCSLIRLPYGPLISVVSVNYDDADGAEQTVEDTGYSLDPLGLLLSYGGSWPSARDSRSAVRIKYTAGYEIVPAPILAAILLMVGDLYANRETVAEGLGRIPMSTTVESLLSPYRAWPT